MPPSSFVSPEASVIAEVSFISMRPSYDGVRATDLRTARSYAVFRRVPATGFLAAASFAGFLPAIGINISF